MIEIGNTVLKKQKNFWNACVFHPTDAVEDPWGRRILDRMAKDGAIQTVRIYSMFEDIVYIDESDSLCFDFRLSDLRLDYLVSKGYDLLIAYAGIPDCIAASTGHRTSVSKNKTRYKGKMWNTSPPKDYALWEQICYEYTKHNLERYGIETMSRWRIQCFNEPDIGMFFLSHLSEARDDVRLSEYCKLYEAFEHGVRRASEELTIGGPALAHIHPFLEGFLRYVRKKSLRLDFISAHCYGTTPLALNEGGVLCVEDILQKLQDYCRTVRSVGFDDIPLVIDEWGMSSHGFFNRDECPALMARETEVFSAYFVKLIHEIIRLGIPIDTLAICLSGQHEMTEDFSGFRNFFTMNFIKKPIYNAFTLAGRLKEHWLSSEAEDNVFVLPTKDDEGKLSVLLSYSAPDFSEDAPNIDPILSFDQSIVGRHVTVWCIGRHATNPYRIWEAAEYPDMDAQTLKQLLAEGALRKKDCFTASQNTIPLSLSPNDVVLVSVE